MRNYRLYLVSAKFITNESADHNSLACFRAGVLKKLKDRYFVIFDELLRKQPQCISSVAFVPPALAWVALPVRARPLPAAVLAAAALPLPASAAPALAGPFGEASVLGEAGAIAALVHRAPEDAPASQNLFIYILEHPSREEAEKNWAAFQADPEWQKVKAESEADGPLVDHIDRYFMDPTSFSALK